MYCCFEKVGYEGKKKIARRGHEIKKDQEGLSQLTHCCASRGKL